MYFSIKAFKGTKRRFENLDNINELNIFIDEYEQLGFDKFIIKAFDSEGLKSRSFYIYKMNILKRILLENRNNWKKIKN